MRLTTIGLVVIVAALLFACGGGSATPTPTSTQGPPTATQPPPPTLSADASDDFRTVAAQIQTALEEGDSAFFIDRAETRPVVCTQQMVEEPTADDPLCESDGQTYDGLTVGQWRTSEVTNLIPVETAYDIVANAFAAAIPQVSDDYGEGSPRVYAITIGSLAATAVMTAVIERPPGFPGDGPLRIAFITAWAIRDGVWQTTFLLEASTRPEEFLIPCQIALDAIGADVWERYPDPAAPRGDEANCPE